MIAALKEDSRGVFIGRWTQFERMAIELVPTWKPMTRNNGFFWHVDPTIERCDADLTDHEDWIYEYLRVPSGGLFVDVGAFVGQHSVRVAKACGCRVIAVEPVQQHADIIERNAELNGVSQSIAVLRDCVGNETATVRLHVNGMSSRVERYGTVSIQMETLDKILRDEDRIDLIKIDVEGMERDVLDGLIVKARSVQRIIIEIHLYLSATLERMVCEWANEMGFNTNIIRRDPMNKFCYALLSRGQE